MEPGLASDYPFTKLTININIFPNTKSGGYWTTTPSQRFEDLMYYVHFNIGTSDFLKKSQEYSARCVSQ
jgi:hypothetical protein